SVLVVVETAGEAAAAAPPPPAATPEEPLADGMTEIPEALDPVVPHEDVSADERREREDRRSGADRRADDRGVPDRRQGEWRSTPAPRESAPADAKASVQASPAVRQRARDLGIDLSQVKYAGDRVRHADLDAYLLYNNGGVAHGAGPRR